MTAPTSWLSRSVADCIEPVRGIGSAKLQARNYKPTGRYPIVDQGQSPISGWTDDATAVIDKPLPLIVFGDHTRAFKYVDFPFVRGADGTQLLRPKTDIEPLFFFYACRAIDLEGRGYNRHFSVLKECQISYPQDSNEQLAIGEVLRRTERALSQQGLLLETANAMKQAAMRELFTRGLRGEAQKETEIGLVPESWAVSRIGDVATRTQYGLSLRGQSVGRVPILRMNCQDDGRVMFRNLQYVNLDEATLGAFLLNDGDLLFNRTNSIQLVGRTAIFEGTTQSVFASYLVRLTVDAKQCLPRYLNYFMNWPATQVEIKKLASRAVGQANINAAKLRTVAFPLVPTLDEQADIVAILDAIDRKITLHQRKRAVLEELFKSLLHKLMTGEIAVADLDLSALNTHSTNTAQTGEGT